MDNENKNQEKKLCIHFTHNDADALGCTLVQAFNTEYATTTFFCKAAGNDVDRQITEYFKNPDNLIPNMLLITDLSVTEDTAAMLEGMRDHLMKEYNHEMKLMLIDHHETNTLMKNHDWCVVTSKDAKGVPISAAKLMFHALGAMIDPNYYDVLLAIAEKISRYDTWEWKVHPDPDPEKRNEEDINILIKEMGIEKALDEICKCVSPENFVFTNEMQTIINNYKERRERTLAKMVEDVGFTTLADYRIALIIPDSKFFNESLEIIYNTYDVEIVMGLNPKTKTVSFRTDKDDVNVARFAKRLFNGGGHRTAAGAHLNTEDFIKYLKLYYESVDEMAEIERKEKEEEDAKANMPSFKFTLFSAIQHALNPALLCRQKKLENPSLSFQTLIDEHLRPALLEILEDNVYDTSKMTLAFIRGIMTEWYDEEACIREEIDLNFGVLGRFLEQFRLQLQDEDGNEITSEPINEEEIPEVEISEVEENEKTDEERGGLEDGEQTEEEGMEKHEEEELIVDGGGSNDDDSDSVDPAGNETEG